VEETEIVADFMSEDSPEILWRTVVTSFTEDSPIDDHPIIDVTR
jgi:hypothetical protein